jgi:dTDP-4-amino-4,6-dideoxygalactose transaminase
MPQIIRELFEKEFKEKFGLEDAIAVNSCTSALIATLWSLDLEPGDEVITTPFTFAATTQAILIAGGKPVFVDIHPVTHLIDVKNIPEAITDRTRAILPVHLFGRICDMHELMKIADEFDLPVIEDAAQALGARAARGPYAGTVGDAGCFSFYKTKNLSTFEGGMIGTKVNSRLDAKRIREIASPTANKREFAELGFNFRMPEPCALIGYEQLKLHIGWQCELGRYSEIDGFYPYVTYELPFCKKRGVTGDCPIAEDLAKKIRGSG